MKYCKIWVRGKVQGVFFRQFTRDKARESGITGFVKNLDDGSVYIEASGTKTAIKELAEWCKTGSPFSNVTEVIVKEMETGTTYHSFEIER